MSNKSREKFDINDKSSDINDNTITSLINISKKLNTFSPYQLNNVFTPSNELFITNIIHMLSTRLSNIKDKDPRSKYLLHPLVSIYYYDEVSPLKSFASSTNNESINPVIISAESASYLEMKIVRKEQNGDIQDIIGFSNVVKYITQTHRENNSIHRSTLITLGNIEPKISFKANPITVLILPDFFIKNHAPETYIQQIRNMYETSRYMNLKIYFLNTTGEKAPSMLSDIVNHIDYYPKDSDMETTFRENIFNMSTMRDTKYQDESQKINLMKNLSITDIDSYFTRMSLIEEPKDSDSQNIISSIRTEKARSNPVLEFITDTKSEEDLGGFDIYKDWLSKKLPAIKDNKMTLRIMNVGVPGTGKSLSAKVTAGMLNVPLVRMNIGRVMDKYLGSSESTLYSALKALRIAAPVVVVMDEVEKQIGGIKSSSTSDGGVLSRLFGIILEFMEENNGVHMIFTANDVSILPPEMSRKGRVKQLLFSDIPSDEERKEIISIHARKNNLLIEGNPITKADINAITSFTRDFVGSEIEELVKDIQEDYYGREKEITIDAIREHAYNIIPLYVYKREEIQNLRDWSIGKVMPVSSSSSLYKKFKHLVDKRAKGEDIEVDQKALEKALKV